MVKEYAQEVSYLKSSMLQLMKRLEAMEKEHVVENQSVRIKLFCTFNVHIYTLII